MHQLTNIFWWPLFLISSTIYLASAEESDCSNCHAETYKGFRYTLYKTKVPWFNAFETCRLQNEFLLSIMSTAELVFIRNFLIRANMPDGDVLCAWTSGTDVLHEGKHVWQSNGRSVANGLFEYREPNGGRGSNCDGICKYSMYGWDNFYLNDVHCNYSVYYICKKPQ